jgi:Rhs element Vgr protein
MPPVPKLAETIKDTNLVSMELLVDGNDLSIARQIVSIAVHQELNKIPTAHIIIVDGEPASENFAASSSNDFKPGKSIEIKLGYNSSNETVFSGIIITNAIRVNNGYSEMNIEAKDKTVKMTVSMGNNHFRNKSDIEIARDLLQQNNISNPDISGTALRHKQLVQSNVTDWDYMISRIDVSGFYCVIDNARVIIRKPDKTADAGLRLTYGEDVLEFHTEMDSRIQNTEVITSVWDFRTQRVITEESRTATGNEGNGITLNDLAGVANRPYQIRSSVSLAQEEIRAITESKKARQELSKIKGRVKYQGTIKIIPGNFIAIDGIGVSFSDKIFVSAIQHEYADGDWTTEATLGWNEQFFSEQTNAHNAASSTGQVSGVQGLQSAVVTDIMDDEGEFRVKVRLPAVNDQDEGIFARVATLDAGNNRGTFFRPEISDEVIVGFMNNDPSHPVILGMLHSSTISSPIQPETSNNKKGYVSRSGIKVTIDDGENSIVIETPGSRIFKLDDSANTITVNDGAGNKITMEPNGVTVEAAVNLTLKAGTTLSLAAPQISIKADGAMSMEGSGGISVKSSGITEITGSMVKIN